MQSSTATSAIQKAAKGNEQSFTDLQVLNEMWSKLSRPLDDVKNKMNEMARGKREKNGRQVAASGSSTLPPPPPTFRFFSEEEWSKKKAQKMHFFCFLEKKMPRVVGTSWEHVRFRLPRNSRVGYRVSDIGRHVVHLPLLPSFLSSLIPFIRSTWSLTLSSSNLFHWNFLIDF